METKMTDDKNKAAEIKPQQQAKNPLEAATNALKEGAAKAHADKVKAQVTKTVEAFKVANNEKKALQDLLDSGKEDAADFAEILSALK